MVFYAYINKTPCLLNYNRGFLYWFLCYNTILLFTVVLTCFKGVLLGMQLPAWAKQTLVLMVMGTVCVLALLGLLYGVYTQNIPVSVGFGVTVPVLYLPIIASVLTVLASSAFWLVGMKSLHVNLLRKLNKAENASLATEVQQDKIQQLQAHIQTLETALAKALNSSA